MSLGNTALEGTPEFDSSERSHRTPSTAGPSRTRRQTSPSITTEDWEDLDSDMSTPTRNAGKARQVDSESHTSSISRTSSPVKVRTSARAAASPRRRVTRKPQLPPPSPRRERPIPTSGPTVVTTKPESSPSSFRRAFGLFFTSLRIAWTIFDWLISPIKPYLLLGGLIVFTAYISYCTLIYYLLPRLPTFLFRAVGVLLRPLGGWSIPVPSWETFNLSTPTDLDVSRGIAALSLPISGLATTSCAIFGVGCEASLLSSEEKVARPFWSKGQKEGKPKIGDAQIAWALTQESRSARTIFESISTLGRKADVFEHIEIWKHGVAVSVESKLDDRNVLGKQLFELGDSSKSLHDEMRKIDSMTVTTFGNLHLEFNDLTGQLMSIQLLDPPDRTDTSVVLARRFDNVLARLDPKLDELILRVSHAVDIAQNALDHSKSITLHLSQISHELNSEISSVPAWKRVSDQVGHYINGGEVPRSKVVRRDLALVEAVVGDISSLLDNLERARSGLLDYQSHTAGFKASLYGVHLAASNGTLDLEAELRILAPLMDEFGTSLDAAKEQRFGKLEVRKGNLIDA